MEIEERIKLAAGYIWANVRMIHLDHVFKRCDGSPLPYVKAIKEMENLIIARLHGPIDFTTVPIVYTDFKSKLRRYLNKNILLDFREVTHVDSSTIANLIFMLSQLQHHNRKFGITHISPILEHHIEIDNVRPLIRVYKNETEALAELMN